MRHMMILTALLALVGTAAVAEDRASNGAPRCEAQHTISLMISFSGMSDSVASARAKLDAQKAQLIKFAQEKGIDKLETQSDSYSINTQMMNGGLSGYNFNGSASYLLQDAAKAEALLDVLAKHNIQASISVSNYYPRPCSDSD